MRVLHLTRDFPPWHCGGISSAVGGLVRAQRRAGLGVAVVSFDTWRPRAGANPPTSAEPPDGVAVLRVAAALPDAVRAFARAERPTLLHVHHGMLWDLAATLRDDLGVPAVKSVHVVQQRMNELRGTGERTLSLAGQEAALAAADRVVAPSRAAAGALLRVIPDLASRRRSAGHGIDVCAAARVAAAHHDAVPSTGPLLTVGRFSDVKGTPDLFEVIGRVLARVPSAEFIVAGGVPANPRAEARWLQRWHATAPTAIQPRVCFTGWLDAAGLSARYQQAVALVVSSRDETFGLAALEAMLHGLPVVATAAGGLPELIAHGETGLLSPPGDVAALVDHAAALAADPTLAQRFGRAAATTARRQHLWDTALPRLLAVYDEIG